ncbi:MAG TPA: hydantoinase/oxoprolinase family protein [Chloroflexota bacterium]|nr:hydantoinase/oxoprolinase family protein [Chloroflexota bacterium]
MFEIAVDIGGTFTDLALYDLQSGAMHFGKVLTTPADPSLGVRDALDASAVHLAEASAFIHGTTVAINTVIEHTGARTALITTRGFRDVLELGRGNRPQSYNIYFQRLEPLVPREWRFEITERISGQGEALTPPRLDELDAIVAALEADQIEAVAICLLNAYRNPAHEVAVAEALRARWPGRPVSVSHLLSREFREYERTSTAVVNAYVAPKMQQYLAGIERLLAERRFRGPFYVVESNAGISLASSVRERPCFLMESGPVAGVIGSARVGELLGYRNVVAFDMGGTTAKTCLVIEGVPPTTDTYYIGGYGQGYPLQAPVLDMVEVGAGGGSIAWTDEVGAVHVGPRSAGADPGPVCYGRGGTQPTVTDANLVLGRLNARYFAGGQLALDADAAEQAIRGAVADRFGMDPAAFAAGIVDLANLTMAEAVRLVTIRRGLDPRDFVLVAYGGGGPLHAAAIARELAIPTVVIPPTPGNFSALGMLLMDLRRDYAQAILLPLDADALGAMEAACQDLQAEGARAVAAEEGGQVERVVFQRFADMRYRGQQHTVKVPLPDRLDAAALADVRARFDRTYEVRYGHAAPEQPAEVVGVRLAVHGVRPRASLADIRPPAAASAARPTERPVYFREHSGPLACPVYQRAALAPGQRLRGPAIVEEASSTTLVQPGDTLDVNEYGYLVLHIGVGETG